MHKDPLSHPLDPFLINLKHIGGEGKGSYCHVCHAYMILACRNDREA